MFFPSNSVLFHCFALPTHNPLIYVFKSRGRWKQVWYPACSDLKKTLPSICSYFLLLTGGRRQIKEEKNTMVQSSHPTCSKLVSDRYCSLSLNTPLHLSLQSFNLGEIKWKITSIRCTSLEASIHQSVKKLLVLIWCSQAKPADNEKWPLIPISLDFMVCLSTPFCSRLFF